MNINTLILCILACAYSSAWATAADLLPSPRVIFEFAVPQRGDLLIAPVTINGRTYPFMVDTGCNYCTFDKRLQHLLGARKQPLLVRVPGGYMSSDQFEAPEIAVGPVVMRPGTAACDNLRDSLVPFIGIDFYGIIGFDCLVDKVFVVDFDGGKFRFVDRAAADAGERVPLEWTRTKPRLLNGPYLFAEVAGVGRQRLKLDTGQWGFTTAVLPPARFDQAISAGNAVRVVPERRECLTLGGSVACRTARLSRFSLGQHFHCDLLVTDGAPGKVGLWYLSRYVVTFDFAHKALYLRPGKEFHKRDLSDLAGFNFFRSDGQTIVSQVLPGSAAEKAGLGHWDELIQLDELRASQVTFFDLDRRLMEPGKHRVVFIRNVDREAGTWREAVLDLVDVDKSISTGAQPAASGSPRIGVVPPTPPRQFGQDTTCRLRWDLRRPVNAVGRGTRQRAPAAVARPTRP